MNYLHTIINSSQILIMRVPYCFKVLVFISVAILLLIDLTKADQGGIYEEYPCPDYYYPGQSSTYSFFYPACTDYF